MKTLPEQLRSRAWEDRQHRKLREQAAGRIEELERALAFYAHGDSYCKLFLPALSEHDPRTFAPVLQDGGEAARHALRWASPYPDNRASVNG